jgi:Flp pilus assembly pilin Flp
MKKARRWSNTLLVGLIAMVCIVTTTNLGHAVSGKLSSACTSLGATHC